MHVSIFNNNLQRDKLPKRIEPVQGQLLPDILQGIRPLQAETQL